MEGLRLSTVTNIKADTGIEDVFMLGDILKMVIELQDNNSIITSLQEKYGINGKGSTIRRKLNGIVQSFIIHNYYDDFLGFCHKNGITIFNEDLDVTKESASYARIIFIVFLREIAGLKPAVSIVEDL